MSEKIINKMFGIRFAAGGRSIAIENGSLRIGHTDYDGALGCQAFWFKNEAQWKEHSGGVFGAASAMNPPIPMFDAFLVTPGVSDGAKSAQEAAKLEAEYAAKLDPETSGQTESPSAPVAQVEAPATPETPGNPPAENVPPAIVNETGTPAPASETIPAESGTETPEDGTIRPIPTIEEIVTAINSTPDKKRFSDVAAILKTDPSIVRDVITTSPNSPVSIVNGGWVSVTA